MTIFRRIHGHIVPINRDTKERLKGAAITALGVTAAIGGAKVAAHLFANSKFGMAKVGALAFGGLRAQNNAVNVAKHAITKKVGASVIARADSLAAKRLVSAAKVYKQSTNLNTASKIIRHGSTALGGAAAGVGVNKIIKGKKARTGSQDVTAAIIGAGVVSSAYSGSALKKAFPFIKG